MRLLKCHIENFGKLHDFTLDFAENPVVINEDNGWGKSTLAAFIKVMFYGFANEKKRVGTLEKERVRFKPWQGGVYGGELEFETGGKRYLLNRTFGAKEADDTFALYDADTNLKTDDFTRDGSRDIGEELFQINEESFLRTIYIAQDDRDTGTTDSINAKLGNLAENLDDINNYEKVQQGLKDLRNSLSPTRKTGELKRLKGEIDELKNEVRKKEQIENSIVELEEKLLRCSREKEEQQGRQKALQEEMVELGRQREILAKKEHYGQILRQCGGWQKAVEEGKAFFGGSAPTAEQLQEALDRQATVRRLESDRQIYKLGDAEKEKLAVLSVRFAGGVPEEEALVHGRKVAEQLDKLRREAAERRFSAEEELEAEQLERRYAGADVREEDIDYYLQQWNLYSDIRSGLGTKKATLSSLKILEEGAAARRKVRVSPSVFLPLTLSLIGLMLYFPVPLAGIALMAAGVVITAVCWGVSILRDRKVQTGTETVDSGAAALEAEIRQDEETMIRAEEQVLQFLREFCPEDVIERQEERDMLYTMKNDLRRYAGLRARQQDYRAMGYEGRIADLEEELHMLLRSYYSEGELGEKREGELLLELERSRDTYLRLAEREDRYRRVMGAYDMAQAFLASFLKSYGQDAGQDAEPQLRQMAQRLASLGNALEELEKCRNERREFEQNYDISNFEGEETEEYRSPEEVRDELQAVSARLEEIGENRNSYLSQLDDRQQEAEQLEAMQERLSQLEAQYEEGYRYYKNLGLTGEYLAKAKESFSAKYMEPIMGAFRYYYEMMSRMPGNDFRLDANIRITKKEAGEQRAPGAFSAGSRDLISIAFRMALVEAMYRREQPFLIFDDSFVNLDDEKLKCAKQFMQKIAEKYQVIYFTCHESRTLE